MLIPVGLVQAQADQEDTGHEQAYPGSTDLAMKEVSKQGKERDWSAIIELGVGVTHIPLIAEW